MLALVVLCGALILPVSLARSEAVSTSAQAEQIGTAAYVYGIPLMEFLSSAKRATSVTVPNSSGDAPVNELGNLENLASPSNRAAVQPNNDTLYSSAHLDLSRGPLVLHVPAIAHHRYYSFEFIDPYTNVFHYVGTRTTGDGAASFLIVGPGFHGRAPKGMREIRSAYNLVWLLGRTLVYGPSDLAKVHRIQKGYRLLPVSDYRAHGLGWRAPRPSQVITRPTAHPVPIGLAFLGALGTALAQNRPPRRDAAILQELQSAGVGPGLQPSRDALGLRVKLGLAAGADHGPAFVANLKAQTFQQSVDATRGWFVPPPDIGDFGTNYNLRAVVARYALAANRPAEAVYINGLADSALSQLNGANHYVITFPAKDLPPARYFWSLTMYNQYFLLVRNPINRYEIGNRTKGLIRNADGSLDIYISQTPPAGHQSNWLPAPGGVFELTLRIYGPKQSVLDGGYRYPPIVQTG